MRTILIGILVFTGWAIFSNYWYVCKIKNLCNDEEPVVFANISPNEKEAPTTEEMAEEKAAVESDRRRALIEAIEETVIYFAFDSSYVLNGLILNEMVGNVMILNPQRILLEGHTCNIGPNDYNYQLGARRAERVQQALVSQGMEQQKIEIKSFGENRPALPNTSEENREQNRRVEITITNN